MQNQQNAFDSRTLLAFVLMFVVWFGWAAYFGPKQGLESRSAGDSTATSLPNAKALGNAASVDAGTRAAESKPVAIEKAASAELMGPPSVDGWTQIDETERGQPVVVRTPLYTAEIDPVGGDILHFVLHDYRYVDGQPLDLIGRRTTDIGTQRAHALRILFEEKALDLRAVRFEPSDRAIELGEGDGPRELVLSATRADGGRLDLIYRIDPSRYGFDVEVEMRGAVEGRSPVALEVAWPGGIAATEPDSALEYREFRSVARIGEEIHKLKFGKLTNGDGRKGHAVYEGTVSWAGVQGKYFLACAIDPDPKPGLVRLGGDGGLGVQTFGAQLGMRGTAPARAGYSVYLGPVDTDFLSVYDEEPWNAQLTKLVDMGPKIFRPVAEVVLLGLRLLHKVIPNWGWTIVLFSVLVKMLFWPLTRSSTESMKRMQELQPKIQKMRERYKDDQQKQSEEMLKLYRENKVNPVGGCLPLLIQMPVFYALFTLLRKSIDLRQAEWMLWIDDLSRPDVLFQLPVDLPVLGDKFALLPVLMALGMWAQTKLQQSTGASPGGEGGMAAQMKMMNTFMPLMMFVLFYNSPSGLVLYWLINTVLTALQTWMIHRGSSHPEPAAS